MFAEGDSSISAPVTVSTGTLKNANEKCNLHEPTQHKSKEMLSNAFWRPYSVDFY